MCGRTKKSIGVVSSTYIYIFSAADIVGRVGCSTLVWNAFSVTARQQNYYTGVKSSVKLGAEMSGAYFHCFIKVENYLRSDAMIRRSKTVDCRNRLLCIEVADDWPWYRGSKKSAA